MTETRNLPELLVPLPLISPTRIKSKVPLPSPGVFFAHSKRYPMMLAFNWGDDPRLVMLGGEYAFHYFSQQMGHSLPGVLVSGIKVTVDVGSRYDCEREIDPPGALVLSEGKVCLVGMRSGETFGDPHLIPLWDAADQASPEAKAGFTRWKIHVPHEEERIALWSSASTLDTAG